MKKIVNTTKDILYKGDPMAVHLIGDSVTIYNSYKLSLGMKLEEAKELYDLLGVMISEEDK